MTDPEKPVFLTVVGGSVTTYSKHNPSFKVIDLDKATMLPINMYTYSIDLDEANTTGQPVWRKLHDYKETYTMTDLSPSSFKDLNLRVFAERALAKKVLANKHAQNKYASDKPN